VRVLGLLLMALVTLGGGLEGSDLGWVTLESRQDAALVQGILARGLVRNGNQILVTVDSSQLARLAQAGTLWQPLMAEIDPDQWVLVQSSHGHTLGDYPGAKAETIVLDQDRMLAPGTLRSMAQSVAEAGLKGQSLAECSVPISYIPTAISMVTEPMFAPPSDTLALRVNQDSLFSYDARLQAFYTRFFRTDSAAAASDWLVQKFVGWGYFPVLQQPVWVGTYWSTLCNCWTSNVLAIKSGWAEPDKVIVIGAHYDSYNQAGAMTHAPGADDNASGTSIVLEMARILKDIPLRKTVIFAPFGAEEIWMYGSGTAAAEFAANGTQLEVMYNYDMVGYQPDNVFNTRIQAGQNQAYLQLQTACAGRVSNIVPWLPIGLQASDHQPFDAQGWPVVYTAEGDFNTPNYHQPTDSTTKLNFAYMTDIARMAAAALGYVADAASPVAIDSIVDQGDGHSLTLHWGDYPDDYTYTVYRGRNTGHYTDSVSLSGDVHSYTATGLLESTPYYFAVKGVPAGGNASVYAPELSELSQVYPRVPSGIVAEPTIGGVALSWRSNHEVDLDHYALYRKEDFQSDFTLLAGNLTGTSYQDNSVMHWITYQYRLKAVDLTGHESALSPEVTGTPASFDKGILVVDEMTRDYDFMPTQEAEEAWLDTILSGAPHGVVTVDSFQNALRRPLAGQYSSIVWIDDDIVNKLVRYSQDTLRWFAGFNNDMLLAGYQTIPLFVPAPSEGHLLYDEFMVQSYSLNNAKDFAGAKGGSGWPSMTVDPTRGISRMGDIPSLTARDGGTVIYRYDSNIDDPTRENTAVGIAYDGPHGKRILLSFPLYYMTPSSAQAFASAVKSYFGETAQTPAGGDLDGTGIVDIGDLALMIDLLFFDMPMPLGNRLADMDGSCTIDISDLQWLLDYLFFDGPAPQASCAP
jgi:hypothetical protein